MGKSYLIRALLVAGVLFSNQPTWAQVDVKPEPEAERRLVEHFTVEGNTHLEEQEIRSILSHYEGRKLTFEEVKAAAADLTSIYQRKGFFLVRAYVPTQDFKSSTVRLQVFEGKIGEVKVSGAEHYDPEFIRERFQVAIQDGQFRSEDFTRTLTLLNEFSDLEVKAVMLPGKAAGTADIDLQVKDKLPLHAGLDYNNYGTAATGQNRIALDVDAGNLLTQGDQLSVRGVLGFPSRQNTFYQAQYSLPVDLDGTSASFSYANGAFGVSQGLGAILDVRGDADIYTFALSHAMDRDLDFNSNLGLTVAHKNIANNFFGGRVPFSHDQYTLARLSYMCDWRGPSGRTILQSSVSQGLGGTSAGDPLSSRAGAGANFTRFNVDLARIHRLDDGLYGVLRGSVQYATAPLFVGEQFAMGGPDTVRGYSQAEMLGDSAYLIGAELRWSPFAENLDAFQMAFFVDHGGVRLRNRQPGDLAFGNSLTGAGLGFRWHLAEQTNLRVDVGFPLTSRPNRSASDPAVYCGLQTRF